MYKYVKSFMQIFLYHFYISNYTWSNLQSMPQKASRTEKRRREGGSQSLLKFQNVSPGITLATCSFNASAPAFYCHRLSTTAVGYRDFYIARIAPQRSGDTAYNVDIDSRTCNLQPRHFSYARAYTSINRRKHFRCETFAFYLESIFLRLTRNRALYACSGIRRGVEITIDNKTALISQPNLICPFYPRDFRVYRVYWLIW